MYSDYARRIRPADQRPTPSSTCPYKVRCNFQLVFVQYWHCISITIKRKAGQPRIAKNRQRCKHRAGRQYTVGTAFSLPIPPNVLDLLSKSIASLMSKAQTTGMITPSSAPYNLHNIPRELRDIIYEYCVIASDVIDTVTDKAKAEQPAITRVCKQIRCESLPFYYSRNTFQFTIHDGRKVRPDQQAETLYAWLCRHGSLNVAQICRFGLVFKETLFHYSNELLQSIVMAMSMQIPLPRTSLYCHYTFMTSPRFNEQTERSISDYRMKDAFKYVEKIQERLKIAPLFMDRFVLYLYSEHYAKLRLKREDLKSKSKQLQSLNNERIVAVQRLSRLDIDRARSARPANNINAEIAEVEGVLHSLTSRKRALYREARQTYQIDEYDRDLSMACSKASNRLAEVQLLLCRRRIGVLTQD